MTEDEYIEGLKRGDEKIFREFVDQYQLSLLKLCIGFLHNEEDAKDIVQDVFIEVFQSIEKFRGDALLSTWLYRIAVNKSLNQIKKNKNRKLLSSIDSGDLKKIKKIMPELFVSNYKQFLCTFEVPGISKP